MTMYKQYLEEYNKRLQKRIVKTNFVAATVVLIFQIAYYFILTGVELRHQTITQYILFYILVPAIIIYAFCVISWFMVYRSHRSSELRTLMAMLSMVAICSTVASVHHILDATLCCFFVPLATSMVFGNRRITNIVGIACVAGQVISMCFAYMGVRGKDPYFMLDCLMLFIVFGVFWYVSLILLKSEQEKRFEIDRIWQLESEISFHRRDQEEMRLRMEQHQIIMNQTTDILFEWDIKADTMVFSSNWQKKFGYEAIASDVSKRIPLSQNISPEDIPAFMKIMKSTAAGVPYSEGELRIKDVKGKYVWCRLRATAQFDTEGHAIKAVGVILDIGNEKKERQSLQNLAQRDPLTGIYNKAATTALVSHRMEDFDFNVLQALMIIDVDYYKELYDTYGAEASDNLLNSVGTTLKNHVRGSDVVGRIDEDEFLVYLSNVENEDDALWKAQSLHALIGALFPEPGAPHITASVGIAVFPHGTVKFSDLYKYANEALSQCKDKGRDGVSAYEKLLSKVRPSTTADAPSATEDTSSTTEDTDQETL